jgi:hypothetical protein
LVKEALTAIGGATMQSLSRAFRASSGSLAMFATIRRASSFGEELGRRSPAGLLLEIDIGQLLPGAVDYDKAGL